VTSLRAALLAARDRLRGADIEDAEFEAELLLRHALGLSRAKLYTRFDEALTPDVAAAYEALLLRRLAHEPSAYITGVREFWGLEFKVTPDVLIPRPETETLVEVALGELRSVTAAVGARHASPLRTEGRRAGPLRVVDVGTGSGAIAVALAKALPQAEVYATDASRTALAVAVENARRHGVERRIAFRVGNLLTPLDDYVDLMAANLPYVTSDDWAALAPELREHEPQLALDGGQDGLDLIRALLRQAPRYVRPGGAVCLEIGEGQAEALRRLVEDVLAGAELRFEPDLAGKPRVAVVRPVLG
jgi:release factor glutamine methyltransferase